MPSWLLFALLAGGGSYLLKGLLPDSEERQQKRERQYQRGAQESLRRAQSTLAERQLSKERRSSELIQDMPDPMLLKMLLRSVGEGAAGTGGGADIMNLGSNGSGQNEQVQAAIRRLRGVGEAMDLDEAGQYPMSTLLG